MELRKIKEVIGIILTVLAVFFLLSLIFVPLNKSIVYINILFELFLISLPVYIIIELYYFVKDTPERKEGSLLKKKKNKVILASEWIFFISLIALLFLARNGTILKKDCPESIQGNKNAKMIVKYFFNPFCSKCWEQEEIARVVFNEHKGHISIERYDQRYCKVELQKYGLQMTPAWVFEYNSTVEKFNSLSHENISSIICNGVECKE